MSDGDVNYLVCKFMNYGKLLGKLFDDLCVGECVVVNDVKEDLFDFVLWKCVKLEDLEGVLWVLKYGMGCLGWYIECLVMGCLLFGNYFDIYGGG